jgi:hypothetical protein
VNLSSVSFGEDDGPLSIEVRAAVSPAAPQLEGSVTPPRHTSGRPHGRRAGPIDPFTPPEVHQPHAAVQRSSPSDSRLDGSGSLASAASSNTEEARHDRAPVSSTADRTASQVTSPSMLDGSLRSSTSSSTSSTTSGSSGLSPSDFLPPRTAERSRRTTAGPQSSADSINISALTDQGTPQRAASRTTAPTQSIRLVLGGSAVSSSYASGSSASTSTGTSYTAPSKAHSSSAVSQGRLDSSSSSGTASMSGSVKVDNSTASAQSAASDSRSSSSSSSMLSYLQASPVAASRPPTAQPARAFAFDTVHSAGLDSTFDSSAVRSSTAQSMESDNISVLSGASSDIAHPAAPTLHTLTRMQVQEALRDLSDESVDQPAPSAIGHSPELQPSSGREEKKDSPYDALYDSWGEDQYLTVRIGAPTVRPGGLASFRAEPLLEEGSEEDSSAASDIDNESFAGADVRADFGHRQVHDLTASAPIRQHGDADSASSRSGEAAGGLDDAASQRSENTQELFDKWQALYDGSVSLGHAARTARTEHVAAYGANTSTSFSTSAAAQQPEEETSFLSDLSFPAPYPVPAPVRPTEHPGRAAPASPLDVFASPAHSYGEWDREISQHLRSEDEHSEHSAASRASQSSDSLAPYRRPLDSLRDSIASSVMSDAEKPTADEQARLPGRHATRPAAIVTHRSTAVPAAAATARVPVSSAVSMSSLSAPVSPPNEASHAPASAQVNPAAAVSHNQPHPAGGFRSTYAGRLVVHREQRPAPRSPLEEQLGLDDSLLESSSDEGIGRYAAPERRSLQSSDSEQEDTSLEELLRGTYTSAPILTALRTDATDVLARLRDPFVAPAAPATTGPSAVPVLSSGEDTYSSGRYYSAGEAQNTSSSTMHTAGSGDQSSPTRLVRTTATVQRTVTATSTLTVHTAHRMVSTATAAAATARTAAVNDSPESTPHGTPQRDPHRDSAPSLDWTPASDTYSSPSAFSGSRLSEYAMHSQHTLTASRMRSPGDSTIESPMHTYPRPSSQAPGGRHNWNH